MSWKVQGKAIIPEEEIVVDDGRNMRDVYMRD